MLLTVAIFFLIIAIIAGVLALTVKGPLVPIMAAVALTTLQFTLRGNPSFGSIGVILALALSFIGLLYFLRTSEAQAEVGEAHGVFWRLSPALEAERAQD